MTTEGETASYQCYFFLLLKSGKELTGKRQDVHSKTIEITRKKTLPVPAKSGSYIYTHAGST
ncbi:hypothetical protein SK128_008266 [Halocaridina rubra]|uniref:Uncharacterized protein n=1 Tax=Halocaridina rubra TaxID=373956 RepID=A0AAN8XGN6_HALRR